MGAQHETISFESRERRLKWTNEQSVRLFNGIIRDSNLLFQKGRISQWLLDRLTDQALKMKAKREVELAMMSGSFFSRLLFLVHVALEGDVRNACRYSVRLLPPMLYRPMRVLFGGCRR